MGAQYRLRILHLSDLHARVALPAMGTQRQALVRSQRAMRERVLGEELEAALEQIAAEAPVDLVCFTGDIADWGLAEEYEQAGEVLARVLERLKLGVDRLYVVPGNHDVSRQLAVEDWRALRKLLGDRRDVGAALGQWANGSKAPHGVDQGLVERVLGRQQPYRDWVRTGLGRAELLPDPGLCALGYRVTLPAGERPFPVHVIGLNSAWLCGDDDDKGKIAVTREQVDLLCRDERAKPLPGFRLALVHHPLDDLADRDAAEVQRALADKGADLLLHGHQHDPQLERRIDPDRALNMLAAGSLYEGDEGDRFVNGFHVIDAWLDAEGRHPRYELTFWGWSEKGHWHRSNAVYREAREGKVVWPATPHPGGRVPAAPPDAESLRRAWHPPTHFEQRGALAPAGFRINRNYLQDGGRRLGKFVDILVALDRPTTSDEVYLVPSRKAPLRFSDPRKLAKAANLEAKEQIVRRFVRSFSADHLEGFEFLMTMRDGSRRQHVYAQAFDDFLVANASYEARNLVYLCFKRGLDDEWRSRVRAMLARDRRIQAWDESEVEPGDDFAEHIAEHLARARVVIVLASAEYLASPVAVQHELTPAIEAARAKELSVLWVPLRAFGYPASALGPFKASVSPDAPLAGLAEAEWKRALEQLYADVCRVYGVQPSPPPKPDFGSLVKKAGLG